MLVVSRKTGERIVINGNIVVEIREINGRQVRIGIEAPQSMSINREEVQDRIDEQKNFHKE